MSTLTVTIYYNLLHDSATVQLMTSLRFVKNRFAKTVI